MTFEEAIKAMRDLPGSGIKLSHWKNMHYTFWVVWSKDKGLPIHELCAYVLTTSGWYKTETYLTRDSLFSTEWELVEELPE